MARSALSYFYEEKTTGAGVVRTLRADGTPKRVTAIMVADTPIHLPFRIEGILLCIGVLVFFGPDLLRYLLSYSPERQNKTEKPTPHRS